MLHNIIHSGAILTGTAIHGAVMDGKIHIDNFDIKNLNPNSYNLHIGDKISTIKPNRHRQYMGQPDSCFDQNGIGCTPSVLVTKTQSWIELDLRDKPELVTEEIPTEGYVLSPGNLYLIPTLESIYSPEYEFILTGRSSMGRLGISVHQEAGFGDIGYKGKLTLQVKVTYPTRIYPYYPMCQLYFLTPHGPIEKLYDGKYQGAMDVSGYEPDSVKE